MYPWPLRHRITSVYHAVVARTWCMRARARDSARRMLRRCFQDTMDCRPVQWVYRIGLWTAVICHCQAPPPGCLTLGRVALVRRTTTKGGSNPPVFPVTRADVYARTPIAHRFVHIIHARVDIQYIVETRNVRAGINKAPYCVNYDRAACPALPVWPQGCFGR